jgi:alpha-galactosidase
MYAARSIKDPGAQDSSCAVSFADLDADPERKSLRHRESEEMAFDPIAEIRIDSRVALVYEEGWQSWSPAGVYPAAATSPRPRDRLARTMGWRPGQDLPARGFQGEGLLAVTAPGEPVRVWFAPEPRAGVASIRLEAQDDRIVVSADGAVSELVLAGRLVEALGAVGQRLAPPQVRPVRPGWCSWYFYFRGVREADIVENLDAAERLSLPIEIVQVDDGYEAGIGDWLEASPRFGSLRRTASRIAATGKRVGVWTAPFLVGERSSLAATHPDWLVGGADAGWNWEQDLRVLDVTHPDAADYLENVYRTLTSWGISYHKLDFLYAGAMVGRRREDCSPLDAYSEGLELIRRAVGMEATLLGCGAPLLPSIGLVDAMRVGPDVLPESMSGGSETSAPALEKALRVTSARAWMHGRLWANDPDCLVVRPSVPGRDAWASHVDACQGVVFSSDRLGDLDERGLELTHRVLRPSSTKPIAWDPFREQPA